MKKIIPFTCVLLVGITVGAATGSKITAELKNQQVNYKGTTIIEEVISYEGSTYVPLRSFSEIVDLPASYKDGVIFLGKNTSATYLSELVPYNTSDYEDPIHGKKYSINQDMVIANKKYTNGLQLRPTGYQYKSIYYNLNDKFTSLRGIIGLDDNYNTFNFDDTLDVKIYCDGNKVYSTEFKQGDLEKDFNVNVEGCKQLKVEVGCESNNYPYVDFVDVILE